jgi:medium-chain acyl-[acyl-carrier-protein] hydrolase
MTALCEYLCSTLQPLLDTKVVLFGHSLGARIAFHVASRVAGTAGLVVSAAPAAHLPPRRQRAQLSGPALLEALRVLGGTPLQVLNDEELMSVFLPGIRADFTLLEQGLAKPDQMLNCPILSLCTRDDHEVKFEDVAAWEQRTTADFRLRELSGGHFYLQEQRENILSEVVNCVERWL